MLTFKKCIKEFAEVLQSKRKEMLKDDDIINDEFNTNTSDDAQCSKNGKIVQYQRYDRVVARLPRKGINVF